MPATDPRITDWARQILTAVDDSIAEGALPATVRSFTDLHDHCDANDLLIEADIPYDGTETTIDLTVAVQDAVTALLQAPDRPWCTYDTCRFPGHDHTTTEADDGNDLAAPVPMRCTDCDQPAHYDVRVRDFRHDNPATPDCFLIRARESSTPPPGTPPPPTYGTCSTGRCQS